MFNLAFGALWIKLHSLSGWEFLCWNGIGRKWNIGDCLGSGFKL